MIKAKNATVTLLAATALLAGCGTNPPSSSASSTQASQQVVSGTGVVESIQPVSSRSGIPLGAVAGGVIGGVLGNQVGSGRGRTAATAAGAIGGAMVGNQVENQRTANNAYQVGVRMDNGGYATINQETVGDIRVGDRVRVDGGRIARF